MCLLTIAVHLGEPCREGRPRYAFALREPIRHNVSSVFTHTAPCTVPLAEVSQRRFVLVSADQCVPRPSHLPMARRLCTHAYTAMLRLLARSPIVSAISVGSSCMQNTAIPRRQPCNALTPVCVCASFRRTPTSDTTRPNTILNPGSSYILTCVCVVSVANDKSRLQMGEISVRVAKPNNPPRPLTHLHYRTDPTPVSRSQMMPEGLVKISSSKCYATSSCRTSFAMRRLT